MLKSAIQSYRINEGKQNSWVNPCIKRSCRHIKDRVVCVINWQITEAHRYHKHISVNRYCTKQLVVRRVRQHNTWPTTKFGTFSNWWNRHWSTQQPRPPNHCPPLTPPLPHSLTLPLRLSSKAHFILSALCPFNPMMKDSSFSLDHCINWSSYEQLTNHKKSHRQTLVVVKKPAPVVKKCGPFSYSADGQVC